MHGTLVQKEIRLPQNTLKKAQKLHHHCIHRVIVEHRPEDRHTETYVKVLHVMHGVYVCCVFSKKSHTTYTTWTVRMVARVR